MLAVLCRDKVTQASSLEKNASKMLAVLCRDKVTQASSLEKSQAGDNPLGHSKPPRRINEIVLGKRGVTADTALRLSRYFGTSERFWLNLQVRYDIEAERDRVGVRIRHEVPVYARAV